MGDERRFNSTWKREGNSFIQSLLDAGLDVNALNMGTTEYELGTKYGTTMLSYAADCGNLEIVEFLVQKGADANVANSDGSKPIHIAAQCCRKDIVKFFLDSGISVNSYDEDVRTPLHYIAANRDGFLSARRESYQELVYILVDRGADLDAVDRRGYTPMQLAAKNCHKQLVKLLIRLGANPECCDYTHWTVLNHACYKGWSGIVRTLIKRKIKLDTRTSKGYDAPVIIAAQASHEDIVKLLIDSGADVKCKGWRGETMLHYACEKGWLQVVKGLVSKGCDLNAKDFWERTPLLMAVKYSHFSIVEYLIEYGGDVKCCDKYGHTLLHYACERGWLEVVKLLIEKGCDVNARNFSQLATPLHKATHLINLLFNVETIGKLLDAGADCNVETVGGETAFNSCIKITLSLEVITLFLSYGAYFQTDDYCVISNNRYLKENILRNTQLCTMALINKFNNADLHKMYEIPGVSEKLPSIKKMKITSRSIVAQDITKTVQNEIQSRGYCNILSVHPIVLNMLCVLTLVQHYNCPTFIKLSVGNN